MKGMIRVAIAAGAAALLHPGAADAAGYMIREQSGSMLGQAFAGQNAYVKDPSIIFHNPAGMSALDGRRGSLVVTGIRPQNQFDDDGSFSLVPLGSEESGDAGEDAIVPALYAMDSYGDWRFGVGVNAPFGLSTSYEDDWIGRYAAIDSELLTINVNPVLSYRFNQYLSLGAGVQLQYIDARLTNAVFLGLAGDALTELQADDWGFGVTAGALIEPGPGTKIGIGFRSSIRHEAVGEATIETAGGVTVFEDDARAEVRTPETIGVSILQAITDRLSIAATVEWTNWSRFDELRVTFDSGIPDDVTEENWHDTFFYSVGVNYQLTPALMLRGGVAYDQSPVRNKYRTARLPDQDRAWVAGGLTYALNDWASFDLGYAHVFVRDSEIRETMEIAPGGALTGTLRGDYENSVDLLAVQANFRF
ncbi:MAG: rane protein involved in aromatic hydrocarbon degradation [Rhodospirillales bacterium]|nr:rane protein involved in aromatic hydrocarbon degradation [Rhodospirillales bacterium]